uniref:MF6LB protein n=1 Tax=Catharus ustulatus TaxID=91951 RepID=A0A8C3UUP8_CATUS
GAMSERWDVGRALALAALFRLLQGAARGCAEPFLPLYLRLLGLSAPLVGAAAGARQLAALAVLLCCPRGRAGRLLLAGSVLGSAGASLALTLIPPAGGTGRTGCDSSLQLGLPGSLPSALPSTLLVPLPTAVPSPRTIPVSSLGRSSYGALNSTPWAALPVQALAGLSSGALRWRLQGTVGDIATPGTERALHALLGGLCAGGAGLGSFGGGFVVQRFGLAVLFQASCVGLGLWILFIVIVQSRLPRQRKINYSRLLAADSSEMSDSEEENEKDWLVKAMKDESFNRNWIQQHGIK